MLYTLLYNYLGGGGLYDRPNVFADDVHDTRFALSHKTNLVSMMLTNYMKKFDTLFNELPEPQPALVATSDECPICLDDKKEVVFIGLLFIMFYI